MCIRDSLHHDPEILLRAGGFLQPPYGLGPHLPFQPLFADWGSFFFLGFQFDIIVNGDVYKRQVIYDTLDITKLSDNELTKFRKENKIGRAHV